MGEWFDARHRQFPGFVHPPIGEDGRGVERRLVLALPEGLDDSHRQLPSGEAVS
ncbi:hypothetical protein [Dactylosporangium fulvum]|uniref:Uncharacterized protein n=1 Tax=Dactylosporangium fulvum TaxID=53359 RepID=A0ABY5VTN3_9ACTN|nr:hypothetical protein [Dactylosporangium fulvum]UWP79166.1 hypothetical protein Dfulv_28815 [Dactylosporangium fulvum]